MVQERLVVLVHSVPERRAGLADQRTFDHTQLDVGRVIGQTPTVGEAREVATKLKIDLEMLKRPLNVGFSGGEKKRMEILQMALLEPTFCILDETDSGLDIDALRIVARGVQELVSPKMGALVITHYQRILDYITPDRVHVFVGGRIVEEGGPELAKKLEAEGYDPFTALTATAGSEA